MSVLRSSVLVLASALAVCAAGSASAASFRVWDAATSTWLSNGTVHFTGPTTLSYLGTALPCAADFTMTVTGGTGQITHATFTGSSGCTGIVTYLLPWSVTPSAAAYTGTNPVFSGAPTLTPELRNVTIGGIRFSAFGANCPSSTGSGSITGVLDVVDQTVVTANRFVFKGMLGPCAVQTRTNTAPNSLLASIPVKIVP